MNASITIQASAATLPINLPLHLIRTTKANPSTANGVFADQLMQALATADGFNCLRWIPCLTLTPTFKLKTVMANAYYQLPSGRVACVDGATDFPPNQLALNEPNGLLAIGGDLSLWRLVKAYQAGIFPWFNPGEPILWWSPSPRMVLFPDELKLAKSLKKTLKKDLFEVRFNTSFRAVISACSEVKRAEQNGTWISADMIDAYCALFDAGHAVCAECWQNQQLVGGCYGVKIGKVFYGESMFHHVSDASKVAFVHLVAHLKQHGVEMIDCQMHTPLLNSLGAREISRENFNSKLAALIQ